MVISRASMRLFGKAEAPTPEAPAGGAVRLHIGCGQQAIPGWVNIDNQQLPGVDRVLDVRRGLPFSGAASIYAEHFLEHLTLDEGLAFLTDCRLALASDGILRISTPNLDWVMATHYRGPAVRPEERRLDCLRMNRAFHGWGHRFLYNRPMLESMLRHVGFVRMAFHRYGESAVSEMRGLERHETSEDAPELPHVLIVEASGQGRRHLIPVELLRELREAIESH